MVRGYDYALERYYDFLDVRNDDLRWILSSAQYRRFMRSVWTSLRRSGRAMMLLLWRTNSYIEITTTVHIIRHSVMADTIMSIVHIMAVMVTIMGLIITDIIKMSTIMPSAITSIMMRFAIVEKIHRLIKTVMKIGVLLHPAGM